MLPRRLPLVPSCCLVLLCRYASITMAYFLLNLSLVMVSLTFRDHDHWGRMETAVQVLSAFANAQGGLFAAPRGAVHTLLGVGWVPAGW